MNRMRHYINLITEASYDAQRDAIIRQFPDREQEIQTHTKWASQNLKKGDRIAWYLRILRAYLSDQLTPQLTGEYNFTSMEQLQHDLVHFYGLTNPDGSVDAAIDAYQYQQQPIGDLIRDLKRLEEKWTNKQHQEKGVDAQPGDYALFEFDDGLKWWWVNRAYCADEGRSGLHCGNVVGQHKPDQRILSLRDSTNRVILTFIREPNGSLGEMKAKGNKKPQEQYHPHIMTLLMWDGVTGISGEGYLPEMNFSVFDLNDQNLNYLDQHKPKLISDQLNVTPFELLKVDVPVNIKQKYLKYAEQKQPSIKRLINNNTYDQWYNEIKTQKDLIFYLPNEYITKFPNYLATLIEQAKKGNNVAKIPKIISRNFDYMREIVAEIPRAIGRTNRRAKGYNELCKIAVTKDYTAMQLIDEESRTVELCELAVTSNGYALQYVPDSVQQAYPELCKIAVTSNGFALQFVPDSIKQAYPELYKLAVTSDGMALEYVPDSIKQAYPELYKLAVTSNGMALQYVPNSIKQAYPELYKLAVTSDGFALKYVPNAVQQAYPEICELAVTTSKGFALQFVPDSIKQAYPEICKIAVTSDGYALNYVPDSIKQAYPELYKLAVTSNGYALQYVPKKIIAKYPRLAEIAYQEYPYAILYMPSEMAASYLEDCLNRIDPSDIIDDDFYKAIISKIPPNEKHYMLLAKHGRYYALMHIPEKYRTLDICKLAMKWGDPSEAIKYVPEHLRHHFKD